MAEATNVTVGAWQPWPELAPYAQATEVDGLHLFYYAAGDPAAPPVVLLHGLGDEADTWRYLLPPLASGYRVLAPDLPGFARSGKPATAYTADFFLGAVRGLLQALEIGPATLVGSSLGAMLVQELALRQPALARSLVLVDGSLYLRSQSLKPLQLLMLLPGVGEWLYDRLRHDPDAAYASLAPYYADFASLPAADRAFLRERVQARVADEAQRDAYLSALRRMVVAGLRRQRGIAGELAALQMPALVIWGTQDRLLPAGNGLALAETLPNADLLFVPEAGHLPHQERPAVVLEALRDHLAAVWG